MSSRKTGFKPCVACLSAVSVTDPHLECIWCLERDHDCKSWLECQTTAPKALREWSLKLFEAWQSTLAGTTPRRSHSSREGCGTAPRAPSPLCPNRGPPGTRERGIRRRSPNGLRLHVGQQGELGTSMFQSRFCGFIVRADSEPPHPSFLGAKATPAQLKEFYEAMHHMFEWGTLFECLRAPRGQKRPHQVPRWQVWLRRASEI
ncbi:hypothetical protein NDU88_002196 [Pleurodeles waltl]|uniref:Uncharacterized protein n=1 Tax=Pleurodeles waltl TaxID=8319 RepID=A0AAV7M3D0_PLEWA|nr:hypothetical protein NDU88_002196 [Pleurodeles waltl]